MNEILFLVLQVIYLMLPGAFANSAPVLFKNSFRSLNIPVDFNKKLNGEPIFGSHKTYRGFMVGSLIGILVASIQYSLYDFEFFRNLSLYDYSKLPVLFGFLMGFGALFGDLVKSFFKRRLKIKPGKTWMPYDQIDSAVGAIVFILPLYVSSFEIILIGLILTFIIHVLTNHVAYALKMKETQW